MGSRVNAKTTFSPGEKTFLDSASTSTRFAVVFEDDGETGHFYGLDTSLEGQQILDALHIYNVEQVLDRYKTSTIKIVWSDDGLKSGLLINDETHAVFDFQAKRGWCRSGFPPAKAEWSKEGHDWDDSVMRFFE